MTYNTTDTLRSAIRGAMDEARALNQEFVATEHLMLALLSGADGEAARALHAAATADEVRSALVQALPRGASDPLVTGSLPFSPKAQRTVATAAAVSQELGEGRVSTRALLLALLDDGQSAVSQALSRSGADLDALKASLRRGGDHPEA